MCIRDRFKDTHDNWWMATRHDIQSYPEFKRQFKVKFWSEATQNIVRDDLCHGRYEPCTGQTPSAYFLGKVCLARNLEPRIPDECLVTKLALHYREEIKQARLCGQIKTIPDMEKLLDNAEQEAYYLQSRQRNNTYVRNNDPRHNHYNSNNNNRSNDSNNHPNQNNQGNNNNQDNNGNNNNNSRPNYK